VVKLPNNKYELGKGAAKAAVKAKAARAAARPKNPPAPKERVYFPSVAPDAFERARRAIEKRFEVFASGPESISFRWRHTVGAGPDFTLTPTDRATATRLMRSGQRRALAQRTPRFESFVALAFEDLETVLDEINGLIEAQGVVSGATGGPMFNAWNKAFMRADGTPIGFREPF
jgi:hypothetical protein